MLLFDEPLSNLDANLRRSMREKIRELQQQFNITSLYVTHDQSEAFAVSDTVLVMNKGEIMQIGAPQTLYRYPASRFMAGFMGDANIFPAKVTSSGVEIFGYPVPRRKGLPPVYSNVPWACARKRLPSANMGNRASVAPSVKWLTWGRNMRCW